MVLLVKTYWETTWATAAPVTPMWQTNIKIGSRMIFAASPTTEKKFGRKMLVTSVMLLFKSFH